MGRQPRNNTVQITRARLKYFVDVAGMNMSELAEELQTSRDNVYRWCREGWDMEWAEWVADILDVDIETLTGFPINHE